MMRLALGVTCLAAVAWALRDVTMDNDVMMLDDVGSPADAIDKIASEIFKPTPLNNFPGFAGNPAYAGCKRKMDFDGTAPKVYWLKAQDFRFPGKNNPPGAKSKDIAVKCCKSDKAGATDSTLSCTTTRPGDLVGSPPVCLGYGKTYEQAYSLCKGVGFGWDLCTRKQLDSRRCCSSASATASDADATKNEIESMKTGAAYSSGGGKSRSLLAYSSASPSASPTPAPSNYYGDVAPSNVSVATKAVKFAKPRVTGVYVSASATPTENMKAVQTKLAAAVQAQADAKKVSQKAAEAAKKVVEQKAKVDAMPDGKEKEQAKAELAAIEKVAEKAAVALKAEIEKQKAEGASIVVPGGKASPQACDYDSHYVWIKAEPVFKGCVKTNEEPIVEAIAPWDKTGLSQTPVSAESGRIATLCCGGVKSDGKSDAVTCASKDNNTTKPLCLGVGLDFTEAEAKCKKVGKRLCTKAELSAGKCCKGKHDCSYDDLYVWIDRAGASSDAYS